MREHKYRAWDKEAKKMYAVPLLFPWDVANFGLEPQGMNPRNIIWQQYTGIKDSKGNEICEGDIVLGEEATFRGDFRETKEIKLNADCLSFLEDSSTTKILGNIYEHKHLLKKM